MEARANIHRCPADGLPEPAAWRDTEARAVYDHIVTRHARVGCGPVSLFTRLTVPVPTDPRIARTYGADADAMREAWAWSWPEPGEDAQSYLRRELDAMHRQGREPAFG